MQKRGQVSLFVIIGIVIVAVIVFLFTFSGRLMDKLSPGVDVEKTLAVKMDSFSQHVGECIATSGLDTLRLIGANGGYIDPVIYMEYKGMKPAVLCTKLNDDLCYNNIYTKSSLTERIREATLEKIKDCIQSNSFSDSEVKIKGEVKELEVKIEDKTVRMTLFYPVTFTSGNYTYSRNNFVRVFDVPLGESYEISKEIVGEHASVGEINLINVSRMYPGYNVEPIIVGTDLVYRISDVNNKYEFFFGVKT